MANFKTKVKNGMAKVEEFVTDHGGTILTCLGVAFVAGIVSSYNKNMTNYQKEANASYDGFLNKVLDKIESPKNVEQVETEVAEAACEVLLGRLDGRLEQSEQGRARAAHGSIRGA